MYQQTITATRKAPSSPHPQRSNLPANRIHHRSRRCRRNRWVGVVRPLKRSQRRSRWVRRPGYRQRDPRPEHFSLDARENRKVAKHVKYHILVPPVFLNTTSKSLFLSVDIQHTRRPCRFFILQRCKLCGHETSTPRKCMANAPTRTVLWKSRVDESHHAQQRTLC